MQSEERRKRCGGHHRPTPVFLFTPGSMDQTGGLGHTSHLEWCSSAIRRAQQPASALAPQCPFRRVCVGPLTQRARCMVSAGGQVDHRRADHRPRGEAHRHVHRRQDQEDGGAAARDHLSGISPHTHTTRLITSSLPPGAGGVLRRSDQTSFSFAPLWTLLPPARARCALCPASGCRVLWSLSQHRKDAQMRFCHTIPFIL